MWRRVAPSKRAGSSCCAYGGQHDEPALSLFPNPLLAMPEDSSTDSLPRPGALLSFGAQVPEEYRHRAGNPLPDHGGKQDEAAVGNEADVEREASKGLASGDGYASEEAPELASRAVTDDVTAETPAAADHRRRPRRAPESRIYDDQFPACQGCGLQAGHWILDEAGRRWSTRLIPVSKRLSIKDAMKRHRMGNPVDWKCRRCRGEHPFGNTERRERLKDTG